MAQTVRAIYDKGTLRLLDPLHLDQNHEVPVTLTVETNVQPLSPASLAGIFGCMSAEDVREMTTAIEDAFEQVRLDEWQ